MISLPSLTNRKRYLGLCLTLMLTSLPAHSQQDGKWKSDVLTGSWWTPSNWEDDEIADGSFSTADFSTPGNVTLDITLSSNVTVGVLTNYTPGSGGIVLSGSGILTLDGGGLIAPLIKLNKATIGVTLAGNEGVTFTTAGGIGGTSLRLTGNNTYTGITSITSGIVTAANNNAFGAGVSEEFDYISMANGTSIMLESGVTINKTLRLSGSGVNEVQVGALFSSGTGVATWAGKIYLDGTTNNRIGGGAQLSGNRGELIISGEITDGLGKNVQINKASGIVTFTAKNTYTGSTGIYRGTLQIAGGDDRLPTDTVLAMATSTAAEFDLNGFNQEVSQITVASGTLSKQITNKAATRSTLTISGDLDSDSMTYAGNLNLHKTGSGNLIVASTSNYIGDTFVGEGRLTLAGLVLNDESHVTLALGAAIGFASEITSGTDTIGAFVYNGVSLALGTHGGIDSGAQFEHDFIFGDGLFLVTSVIPEPGTLAFVLSGAGVWGLAWRRRRTTASATAQIS